MEFRGKYDSGKKLVFFFTSFCADTWSNGRFPATAVFGWLKCKGGKCEDERVGGAALSSQGAGGVFYKQAPLLYGDR